MKGLYSKKNADNTTNAVILGLALIALNVHSFLILLEYYTNLRIGIFEFWIPDKSPKVIWGYLGGFFFGVLFLSASSYVRKNILKKDKYYAMKQIVIRGNNKSYAVLYTSLSVVLCIVTVILLITTIIPKSRVVL